MKKTLLLTILALLISFTPSLFATETPFKLEQLLAQYSKEYYALNPLKATQAGIHDYNNQLGMTIKIPLINLSAMEIVNLDF